MGTTIFTSCNRAYEPFALPHIVSALHHNDDVAVEVCVEQPKRFRNENKSALSIVNKLFPDRVLIRSGNFDGMLPNSVRFLEEPELVSEFTYISDIDILILSREITESHLAHMQRTQLPYSNVLRPNTQRLTGLHFTRTAIHFPLAIPDDLDLMGNDENILYRLVVSKNLPTPDPTDIFRPMHGFHFSLNRVPLASQNTLDWRLKPGFLDAYLELVESTIWKEVFPHFYDSFKMMLLILDAALQARFPDRIIFQPGDAKSLFRQLGPSKTDKPVVSAAKAKRDESLRNSLIAGRRFSEAIELQRKRLAVSPMDPNLHHQMAWLQAAVRDVESALVHELVANAIAPDNPQYLKAVESYRSAWRKTSEKAKLRQAAEPIKQAVQPGDNEKYGASLNVVDKSHENMIPDARQDSSLTESVFTTIFSENKWKGTSVSGPGSSLHATVLIRGQLQQLFTELGIRVLCDAACGDAGWITEITSDLDYYFGFDIVEELAGRNLSSHQRTNHFFRTADISRDVLPTADAILCRDCLVHLPFDTGLTIIDNFKSTGSRYLLLTTFPTMEQNGPSGVGGWRPLNMTLPPYNLPSPIRMLRERRPDPNDKYNDKSLGVWSLSEL